MSGYEVPQPILNSPFDPPAEHWHIVEGEEPERVHGRRKAVYFYRDPKAKNAQGQVGGVPVELTLVKFWAMGVCGREKDAGSQCAHRCIASSDARLIRRSSQAILRVMRIFR